MAAPVWSRFTKIRHGKETKFRIQEVTKDMFKQVIEMAFEYFVPEEPVHISSKLLKDRVEAIKEYKQRLLTYALEMDYQIDACCIDDVSEELQIVGASIMTIEHKGDKPFDLKRFQRSVKTEELRTLSAVSETLTDMCNVLEKYKLDSYYNDVAGFIHPDYRRIGLVGELLKARAILCIERGVPMTGAWMTTIGTQKAGAKLGWETIAEVNYVEFGRKMGVSFDGIKDLPPSCKLMVKKV